MTFYVPTQNQLADIFTKASPCITSVLIATQQDRTLSIYTPHLEGDIENSYRKASFVNTLCKLKSSID